jgi:bifunctional DNA-binding transcriptional regulator/antitoxin component of YhaV-PrlF toxin-antitoxin module
MTKKSWTMTVEEDTATEDCIITFPPNLLEAAGWKEGDTIEWTDLGNGSWQLAKKISLEVSTSEEEEAWQQLDKQLKEKQNGNNQ